MYIIHFYTSMTLVVSLAVSHYLGNVLVLYGLYALLSIANFNQHTSVSMFGDKLAKMEVKLWFEQRNIPNNIDNLLKVVMDSLL